ncbi:H/ACA ribonucleoprotein complex non-core subunit NAF1 [Aphelenchoides fujianensis]|nr:H/ACA ribonucleoprotein complex non-core subunit NAF1 [Aphelenchoides fujianensis]
MTDNEVADILPEETAQSTSPPEQPPRPANSEETEEADEFFQFDAQPSFRPEFTKHRSLNAIANAYDSDSSSDDSEFEFELNIRPKSAMSFYEDAPPRLSRRPFDSEYYELPPIESVKIDKDAIIPSDLKAFGVVCDVIEFVATVRSNAGIPPLDYDTVLFDCKGEVVAPIFEIFGPVDEPMYALRFSTPEEAAAHPAGLQLFYVPENPTYTRVVFPGELEKRPTSTGTLSESEFSDDEAERVHTQKKRSKNRNFPSENPQNGKRMRQSEAQKP